MIVRDGKTLPVVMTNPLKQGLKQYAPDGIALVMKSRNDESTKTRIETGIAGGFNIPHQGRNDESTKTRIETVLTCVLENKLV